MALEDTACYRVAIIRRSDLSTFIIGFIAGVFGMAYFVYGKRQQKFAPMLCGVLLGIYPYMTSNPYVLVLIGAALLAVPFFTDF
ncbi:MAG: hypothetical protein JO002_04085 [Burkholderiaceae bacterium]|nr:hypothetical protein [Burkholderiaceae bacterium]